MDILRRSQKFCSSSTCNMMLLNNVKQKVEDGTFFVAFSEYLSFRWKSLPWSKLQFSFIQYQTCISNLECYLTKGAISLKKTPTLPNFHAVFARNFLNLRKDSNPMRESIQKKRSIPVVIVIRCFHKGDEVYILGYILSGPSMKGFP